MTVISPLTEQFIEQVKNASIEQLVAADKAGGWFGILGQDGKLSAAEIQKAFAEGTLTYTKDEKGNEASSATIISKEQAANIVHELSDQYPQAVKGDKIDFRALKAALDPKSAEIQALVGEVGQLANPLNMPGGGVPQAGGSLDLGIGR